MGLIKGDTRSKDYGSCHCSGAQYLIKPLGLENAGLTFLWFRCGKNLKV